MRCEAHQLSSCCWFRWINSYLFSASWQLQDLIVTLSTLLRGSVYERLRWTFRLYDINGDGCISRNELSEIVQAIHELMGRRAHQPEEDRKARDQVSEIEFVAFVFPPLSVTEGIFQVIYGEHDGRTGNWWIEFDVLRERRVPDEGSQYMPSECN